METTHRMKSKIGENEFEAEGDRQWVDKKWEEFKAIVAHTPKAHSAERRGDPAANALAASLLHSKIPKVILDRVFRQGDPLSLMDTPKTDNAEADALLVLIYGHTEMIGQPEVTAAALAKSASKTGVDVYRIGRTLAAKEQYIRSSGVKKGTRYSLNNRGIVEAERLIKSMVE
jgi:hypothetical protein